MSRLKTQILFITCRQSKAHLVQVDRQIAEIRGNGERLVGRMTIMAEN